MGLLDVLRSGIKTADKILKPLESTVSYQRVMTRDEYGAPATYASPVFIPAIVDFKSVPVRNKEGITIYSSATLTFLDLATIEEVTSNAGFYADDEFILPDGTTGKVLSLGGFMDAGTTRPLPTTVMIG